MNNGKRMGFSAVVSTAQNDLFSTQEQRDSEEIGQLRKEYIVNLNDFKGHTFKVKDDEEIDELKDSVVENGIFQPIMCSLPA